MKFRDLIKMAGPWLPGAAVAVCVAVSLSGYTAPTFEPRLVQTVEAAENEETESRRAETEETEALPSVMVGDVDLADCQDGIYEGSGQGFQNGKTTVRVTIKDHKITAIAVVSHQDTDSYFNRARSVIDKVLGSQTLEVDMVSGATYSSRGILEAISNALKRAAGQDVSDDYSGNGGGSGQGGGPVDATATTPENLKDGSYTGSAQGYGGITTVSVTVSGGRITAVNVVSHHDTPSYFARASVLCSRIVANNGVNGIDAVSGATYSSRGIIKAVANALSQAGAKPSDQPETEDDGSGKVDVDGDDSIVKGQFPYLDGVYMGSGEGNGGEINVSIVIKDETLTSLSVVSAEHEDEPYITKAKGILMTILKKQSSKVDVISGATYSSEGILEAVEDALAQAAAVTEAARKPEPTPEPVPETEKEPETETGETEKETETEPETETETEAGRYIDGTYSASATVDPGPEGDFDPYQLSMQMTVSGGRITGFGNVVGSGELYDNANERYISRALNGTKKQTGISQQVIAAEGLDGVNAVSGATWTSNAMIQMIRTMLSQAAR